MSLFSRLFLLGSHSFTILTEGHLRFLRKAVSHQSFRRVPPPDLSPIGLVKPSMEEIPLPRTSLPRSLQSLLAVAGSLELRLCSSFGGGVWHSREEVTDSSVPLVEISQLVG